MFRFFKLKKWFVWSWLGSLIILSSLWVQVKIDVKINEWFGIFYDMIQKALASPNAITIEEYWSSLASFITLAGMYIALYVAISFFTAHYLFRWRTAMVEWYHSVYDKAGKIEGASQRVQEDTIKFTRIMEGLGTSFIESVMVLFQFVPILLGLSIGIPIDNPNKIGTNWIRTITDSIKLVPSPSIIRVNFIVSSCTLCEAPSILPALS